MRHFSFVLLAIAILIAAAVIADGVRASAADANRVQIVEDDDNGILRIVIDGKDVARFDANGLVVEGTVRHGRRPGGAPVGAGQDGEQP